VANLSVRLMARMRGAGILIFAACLGVYYYVRMASCLSWLSTVLGFGAMHIVMTALVILVLYLGMPRDPDAQDGVLQVRYLFWDWPCCYVLHNLYPCTVRAQVWLQEFAWREDEKLRRLQERSSSLRLASAVKERVDREPMFCVETSVKLYYFSHVTYFYDKV
jgi:hypothetical protein